MNSGLYVTHLGTPDKIILQQLFPSLSKKTQSKIINARILIDEWRYLLSDLLTHNVLAQELGVSPDLIKIEFNSYGKPILVNKMRHFNISYSKNLIVLATDSLPIGVDIEYVQSFNDLEDVITQFTQEEQNAYYTTPAEQKIEFFYELWTLKESYVKATGKGLSCALQSFNIRISVNEVILSRGIDSDMDWYFQRYTFENQYKCAICGRHKQFPQKALIVNAYDLLKR